MEGQKWEVFFLNPDPQKKDQKKLFAQQTAEGGMP
jgi:hypothetical protein